MGFCSIEVGVSRILPPTNPPSSLQTSHPAFRHPPFSYPPFTYPLLPLTTPPPVSAIQPPSIPPPAIQPPSFHLPASAPNHPSTSSATQHSATRHSATHHSPTRFCPQPPLHQFRHSASNWYVESAYVVVTFFTDTEMCMIIVLYYHLSVIQVSNT